LDKLHGWRIFFYPMPANLLSMGYLGAISLGASKLFPSFVEKMTSLIGCHPDESQDLMIKFLDKI